MTAVGVALAAVVLLAVPVRGKQVRVGSVVIGVVVGLMIGATPVGPTAAKGIEGAGSWAKVSHA